MAQMSKKNYPHGYYPAFRAAASEYYNVDSAIRFFDSAVPSNCFRWRCVLCGWGMDVTAEGQKMIGACCCGGCGQTTLRPLAEWSVEK